MLTADKARKKAMMVNDLEVCKLIYKIEDEICKNCSKGYFYAVVFPHVLLTQKQQEEKAKQFTKEVEDREKRIKNQQEYIDKQFIELEKQRKELEIEKAQKKKRKNLGIGGFLVNAGN